MPPRKAVDTAATLLDIPTAPPAPPWEAEFVETIMTAKDVVYKVRRLADRIPADADPQRLIDGAQAVLRAMNCPPDLLNVLPIAKGDGMSAGAAAATALGDAFREIAAAMLKLIDGALDAGANDKVDPIIRTSDFAHLEVSTSGVPMAFGVVESTPPGHPARTLSKLLQTGLGPRVVLVRNAQYHRLSAIREHTETLETRRAEKEREEEELKRQRDERARLLDQKVDNTFLRNRVAELEAKLAGH